MLGSTERKEFDSEFDAWSWIHDTFEDKQWYHDHEASKVAGYGIYRDIEEHYNYICCLGDRFEVNLKEGNQTINLWIKPEETVNTEGDCCENYRTYEITATELDVICDSLYLCCNAFASNDIQTKQFKNVDDIIYKLNLIKKLREGWETL